MMSADDNKPSSGDLPVLTGLLTVATKAQGDLPPDISHSQMSDEDRVWLEEALREIASDSDPVRKMKQLMAKIDDYKKLAAENVDIEQFNVILEELNDLVCDLDLALDFCKLGGLVLAKQFLQVCRPEMAKSILNMIAIISQHNPPVQEQVRSAKFLEHCLDVIQTPTEPAEYKRTAVYAISSIVKAYVPALSQFTRQKGTDILLQCFDRSLEARDGRLANRCAIAALSIRDSFPRALLDQDKFIRRVVELPLEMHRRLDALRQKLEQQLTTAVEVPAGDDDTSWFQETLDLLEVAAKREDKSSE